MMLFYPTLLQAILEKRALQQQLEGMFRRTTAVQFDWFWFRPALVLYYSGSHWFAQTRFFNLGDQVMKAT